MSSAGEIIALVSGRIKDDSGKIETEEIRSCLTEAVKRYSTHRPAVDVEDIDGDGGHDYDLPEGWVDGFSAIRSIEYPIGDIPATLLDAEDYSIYQSPDSLQLRLISDAPPATEEFRVSYTIPRTAATILDGDIEAVVNLTASLCCEILANVYAQTSDATIGADIVNYRSKSSEFAARAKRLMALYKEHLGIREDDSTPAAAGVSSLDMKYPGGMDRLTHPARQRRLR